MKILIISEYIAPLQAIASVRWTKISKYIKRSHPQTVITVLTTEKALDGENGQKKDALLERDMGAFDAYWQVPKSKALARYEKIKKKNMHLMEGTPQSDSNLRSKKMRAYVKNEIILASHDFKQRLFCNQAMKFLKNHKLDFDVVISTYGPAWTHLVAEKIKKENPHTTWIADFRDPYAKDTDAPLAFRRHNHFVRVHCSKADIITRVMDTLYLNQSAEAHVETVPNGYDPAERLPCMAPRSFDMVFTGTLYGKRTNLCVFFQALKEMKEEGVLDEQTARIIYAGGQGVDALAMAKEQDAEEFLIDKGIVPRREALELQQKAAILIQLGWNETYGQCMWTGKTYEYMLMGKPIAYAVTGDVPFSLASKNINRLGGVCYEQCRHEETYPLLKKYILNKYFEWKTSGDVTIERDEEYVAQYSYQQIAEHIWKLIQQSKKE